MGQDDAAEARPVSAVEATVPCELVAAPQDEPEAARLEEDGLFDLLPRQPRLS